MGDYDKPSSSKNEAVSNGKSIDTSIQDHDNSRINGFYHALNSVHELKNKLFTKINESNRNDTIESSDTKSNNGGGKKTKKKSNKKQGSSTTTNMRRHPLPIENVNFRNIESYNIDDQTILEGMEVLKSNPDCAKKMMIGLGLGLSHVLTASMTIESILKEIDPPTVKTNSKSSSGKNSPNKNE